MNTKSTYESFFQLVFNFESIGASLPEKYSIECKDHLIFLLDEITEKVIETIYHTINYEPDIRFNNYDRVEDLINEVKEKVIALHEVIEFKSDPEELEELGTDCNFLPCFPDDDYTLSFVFRNVNFGRLGCRSLFEEPTTYYPNSGRINYFMAVNAWSADERMGYEFADGEMDYEFTNPGPLSSWGIKDKSIPNMLIF